MMALGRRGQIAARPLGEGVKIIFDMVASERLDPGAQRDLARERETSQTDQLLVLDEDATQRDLPTRRQARRSIDCSADFR